jgi:hypothetical protein
MTIRKTKGDQEIFDEFINVMDYRRAKEKKEYMNRYLLSKGLYRLVETDKSDPNAEYDSRDLKYWKKIPIEISDEQFQKLLSYDDGSTFSDKNIKVIGSSAATVLGVLIIIVGLLVGIYVFNIPVIGPVVSIPLIFDCVFTGIICITLGNINQSVKLIKEILKNKMK